MDCKHGRLKIVSKKGEMRVFCADCGRELNPSVLEAKNEPDKAVEAIPKAQTHAKKRTAKKAE